MSLIKLFFFVAFCFCATSKIFSTAQIPDLLIEGKDTLAIFANPLDPYLKKNPSIEFYDFVGCGSTACWRNYQAIWELKNDSLFLARIRSCHKSCGIKIKDANLKKMFPSKYSNQKVFADWINETILSPSGELIEYVHMGYLSKYQYGTFFTFENGVLKTISYQNNIKPSERKISRREIGKHILDTIFHHIENNLNWDKLGNDLMCDEEYILKFNRRGKIRKVILKPYWDTKKENWLDNFHERKCRRKIKRSLKKLKINYLNLDFKGRFEIPIEIFYDDEKQKLELWDDEYW